MPEEILFETELRNKSKKVWQIKERNGTVLALIVPGGSFKIMSSKATTFWSRYSAATRNEDGSITVKINKRWSPPWQGYKYFMTLCNEDTVDHNTGFLPPNPVAKNDSGYVMVPAGFPDVLVPMSIFDQRIKFLKFTWRMETVERKLPGSPYFVKEEMVMRVDELRPAAELDAIVAERAEIIRAQTEEEAEKQLDVVKKQLLPATDDKQ
jgi:hypothetical protein